ncbi:4147_t:CDS:2 [Entrophospora sp. SA101]|nr:4147_t:CDS:2 [Entrophospora sp. SA101]CAJ0829568.1 6078_t:CDS:2 [Entrophospora sp. SA101]CAJ0915855.1 5580_t:CDS:2 [Entrophospora sp. SA101]CAJ0915862.1 5584_t:CDS:2 [Entrophospora sp. SA101]
MSIEERALYIEESELRDKLDSLEKELSCNNKHQRGWEKTCYCLYFEEKKMEVLRS